MKSNVYSRIVVIFGVFGCSGALLAQTPEAPLPDPSGMDKPKFISMAFPPPPDGQPETALRIHFVSLHNVVPPYSGAPTVPFTPFEGLSVWAGPPGTYVESAASQIPFHASFTQCTPHYRDWSTIGLLHVTGAHIVPSSIYRVEQVPIACQGQEDECAFVSTALEIRTRRMGDIATPFTPPSPTVQPDLGDTAAVVNKFRGVAGAPIKAVALVDVSNLFGEISVAQLTNDLSFGSISWSVLSFCGFRYPGQMGKCANSNTPCTTDANCGANGPCELYCPE